MVCPDNGMLLGLEKEGNLALCCPTMGCTCQVKRADLRDSVGPTVKSLNQANSRKPTYNSEFHRWLSGCETLARGGWTLAVSVASLYILNDSRIKS